MNFTFCRCNYRLCVTKKKEMYQYKRRDTQRDYMAVHCVGRFRKSAKTLQKVIIKKELRPTETFRLVVAQLCVATPAPPHPYLTSVPTRIINEHTSSTPANAKTIAVMQLSGAFIKSKLKLTASSLLGVSGGSAVQIKPEVRTREAEAPKDLGS
jgi:hypothetical protein